MDFVVGLLLIIGFVTVIVVGIKILDWLIAKKEE